jgi:TonB-linked SusC/RagA family outer membrane protein
VKYTLINNFLASFNKNHIFANSIKLKSLMRKFLMFFSMLMLSAVSVFAQTHAVSGTVKDDAGVPVPYATVTETGTKNATTADANGNFTIKMKGNGSLSFTATGFNGASATPEGNTVTVSLKRNAAELSTVVVTGYGIRRQAKELGTSTARLNNNDLTQGKVTNIATGLSGKVSGLQVVSVNSGVNQDTRITLRGNRSILGNNQALIVVDDIIMSRSQGPTFLAALNPNDVENVTVLKGSTASAIYGSDGSNGVIIVSTKKGTKGAPVIRYSNTTEIQEVAYLPDLQNKFGSYGGELDPNQYPGIVYFPENPFVPYVPYENQSYGPAYNGAAIKIGAPVRFFNADGTFIDSLKDGIYSAKPGAKKGFFDKGLTIQNDFSISGGDDKSRFFFSVQDVDIKGTVPRDKSHRNVFRLNGSRELGRLTLNYSADYTLFRSNTTPGSFAINTGPSTLQGGYGGSYFQNRAVYWTILNTPPHIDLRDYRNWRTDPFANPNGYFNAYYGNPWWQIDATRFETKRSTLIGNLSANFRITDWFNLTGGVAISRIDQTQKYTREGFKFADWAKADVYGSGRSVADADAQDFDGFNYNQRFTGDVKANFNKDFNKFSGKLILGATTFDETARRSGIAASSLVIPGFYNISNRVGEPSVDENFNQVRKIGAYADLTIGFNNYLFLHGSFRNDWDSRLAKDLRSYSYPGVDLSFVFTDAIPGLRDNKFLNFGKIRGAYGKTGQVSVDAYSLENVFNSAPNFPYGSVAGFTVDNNLNNPLLKPELTTEKEIGLELGFLRNRIGLNVTVYKQNTINQTLPVQVSSTTGFGSVLLNSGEMQNKGIEVDLRVTALQDIRNGLKWDLQANFAYTKNEVLSLYPGIDVFQIPGAADQYVVKGAAFPQIKLNDWKRDPQGRVIVDRASGFPTVNDSLSTYGTPNPPYSLGLSTSFNFKGLTLSVLAEARFGAVIYNSLGSSLDFTGVSAYSAQVDRQRFVLPNSVYDDGTGKYVANTNITVRNGNNDFWASTWNSVGSTYLNSADFWKIREVSLSFQIPRKVLDNVKWIKQLSIGIVGRNLVTWRAKENVWTDPEFSNTTGNAIGTTDINQNPPTRIFGANLNVTF